MSGERHHEDRTPSQRRPKLLNRLELSNRLLLWATATLSSGLLAGLLGCAIAADLKRIVSRPGAPNACTPICDLAAAADDASVRRLRRGSRRNQGVQTTLGTVRFLIS